MTVTTALGSLAARSSSSLSSVYMSMLKALNFSGLLRVMFILCLLKSTALSKCANFLQMRRYSPLKVWTSPPVWTMYKVGQHFLRIPPIQILGHIEIWTDGHVNRHTSGQAELWTDGHLNIWENIHLYRQTSWQMDIWTNRNFDRRTSGQMNKQTDMNLDRQTD